MDFVTKLFSSDGFMPHGHCYFWNPPLVWLHVISDGLITLAYLTIPVTLIYIARKRKDLPFDWMFACFGIFILACGATHALEIWTLWIPTYWLSGMMKAITALASIATAILLVRLIPRLLTLPSPGTLHQVNCELRQEMAERIRIEGDLHTARSVAERANTAKGEFLARMSHEIRTPMNGVIGMTSLLLDTELSDDQRHYAGAIARSSESLLSIINDILDFSKMEAGKLSFETVDFDLREIVESCLEMLDQRAQSNGLALASLVEFNVPTQLQGDPGRLRQVLTNLIDNAIKFTERGKVSVTVSLENETEADVVLRFEVQDTGSGILPEAQEGLFQPFIQANRPTNRKSDGTGLGLVIARQLVEIMHGQIGIRSAPGHGSIFWFTARLGRQATGPKGFPIISDDLVNAKILVADDHEMNRGILVSPVPGPPKIRILLAEDNIVNQEVAEGFLRKLGFPADTVADGNKALAALERTPYDIILMDCQMPVLDGYETTRQIRQLEQKCVTPFKGRAPIHIIALTANAMEGDREKCLTIGMNDYLSKPVRERELKAALDRWGVMQDNRAPAAGSEIEHGPANQETVSARPNELLAEEPILVIDRLREVTDNEPARMRRLINIYLTRTGPMLDELNAAIQSSSSEQTALLAHKLKGSSISIGVQAFTHSLSELEQLEPGGDLSRANELFDDVRRQFPRVQSAFDLFLQTIPSSDS